MAETQKEAKTEKNELKPETAPEPQKQTEIQELTELLKRVQANFENYRKQAEKRFEEFQQFSNKEIILQLLEIIDNFELALKNSKNCDKENFIKGMELVYSQLNNVLEKQGLKPIQIENQKFDPYLHEALIKEKSEMPENTILEEFQKGYTLKGKVIRHAKIKLSSK